MDLGWLAKLQSPIRTSELSPTARRGLELARTLELHYAGTHGDGINQLATYHRVHPATIRRWISAAARQLQRRPRRCELCDNELPLGARRSRRYCDEHATTLARVHRHRAGQRT